MRKLIYALVLLTILLFLTTSRALACSGFTPSFWEAYTSATTVFSGEVVNIERPLSVGDIKVTFHVLKSWKGPQDEYFVVTDVGRSAGCGIPFGDQWQDETDSFLVYAYGDEDNLSTHIFSRTTRLSIAGEDVMKLNIITNPAIIVIISAVMGLAVIGIGRYFWRKDEVNND